MSLGYRVIPFKHISKESIQYFSKLKTITIQPFTHFPPITENSLQPWIMNPNAPTAIIQNKGVQTIELYNPTFTSSLFFTLKSNKLFKNQKVCINGPYLFKIDAGVFFRSSNGKFKSNVSYPSKYYESNY